MTLKKRRESHLGRLVTFELVSRLAAEPWARSDGLVVTPGDVGIIVDIELSTPELAPLESRGVAHSYFQEPMFWYRVQMSEGSGWFNTEASDWKLLPEN